MNQARDAAFSMNAFQRDVPVLLVPHHCQPWVQHCGFESSSV